MNSIAIVIVTVLAACFGQIVGRAVEEVGSSTGLAIGLLTGLAAGVIAAVRPPDPAGLTWRRIEFFTFPMVGIVVLVATGGLLGILAIVVTLMIVVTIRALVESTAGDLAMLDRLLDDRPTGAPADRLRLRMLGVGLFLASVAGYTNAVEAGFTDLARSAVGGQLIGVVLWFGLGVVAIGTISRNARQRAWRVNGVEVGERVADRWALGVAGAALLVVTTAVVTPIATSQVSAVPAQAISETDGLNRFVTRALELFSRGAGANEDTQPRAENEDAAGLLESLEGTRGDSPGWVGYLLLASVIGTIFLWAIRAGRRARFDHGGSPIGSGGWRGLKALLAALGRELRAVVVALARLFRLIRWRRPPVPGRPRDAPRTADVPVGRRWSPTDPAERRIARSFADIADLEPPRLGETPAEVAQSVGNRTDPADAATVVGGYLLARYSPEPVEDDTADRVERAARRVTDAAEPPDVDPSD